MAKIQKSWPFVVLLLAFFFKSAGAAWDVSYHFKHFREFYQLPHILNAFGDFILLAILPYFWRKGSDSDRKNLKIIIWGVVIFIAAIGLDQWYHQTFGIDLTTWSPSHFALYAGTFVGLIGAFRLIYNNIQAGNISSRVGRVYSLILGYLVLDSFWFPLLQQEQAVIADFNMKHGKILADPDLLAQFLKLHLNLYGGLPMWLYGAWAVLGAIFAFHFLRRLSLTGPWAATIISVIYVAFRFAANQIFVFVNYQTSTVPYYLIAAGLLFDIIFNIYQRRRRIRDLLSIAAVIAVVLSVSEINLSYPVLPPMPFMTTLLASIPAAIIGYYGARLLALMF